MTTERMDEIFCEVGAEYGITTWWELFDGDEFEEVERRITEELGFDCWEDETFVAWYSEMADEL